VDSNHAKTFHTVLWLENASIYNVITINYVQFKNTITGKLKKAKMKNKFIEN